MGAKKLDVASDYNPKAGENQIKNSATFRADAYNSELISESQDEVVTTIEDRKAELSIDKQSSNTKVSAGEEVTYTISLKNTGSLLATGMDSPIIDTLPQALTLTEDQKKAIETLGGKVEEIEGRYSITFSDWTINPGEVLEFTFSTTVRSAEEIAELGNLTYITNTAKVEQNTSSNNVEYERPNLGLQKTTQGNGEAYKDGETVPYTVQISNDGTTTINNVIATDWLPKGLQLMDDSGNAVTVSGTYTIGGHNAVVTVNTDGTTKMVWNMGALQPDQLVVLEYQTQVVASQVSNQTGQVNLKNTISLNYGQSSSADVKVDVVGLTSDKVIVENQEEKKHSEISEGKEVVYYLKLTNESDKSIVVKDVKDILPNPQGGFSWTPEQIKVTTEGINAGFGANFTSSYGSWDGATVIRWDSVTVPANTTLVQEIRVTFPSGDTWESYLKTLESVTWLKIQNTFTYSGGPTHQVSHSVAEDGLGENQSVSMQKGVYQLGELSGEPGGYRVYQNGTQGISRTYYSAKENYVTYYVVIANTGEGDLVLDKAVDHLPTGLQYQGMSTNPYYWSVGSGTQNVDLYQITTPEQPYVSLNKPYSFKAITVNAQYAQEKNQLLFSFAKDGGQAVLKSGEAISFIYHCRIDSSATSSELSVNTIGLALEKETEIDGTLKATHNSSSNVGQTNDGNCSAADAIDTEKYNEALGEGSNKYFIESSVAIYPGGIRPGIEKKATKYKMNGSGDFFPITQATQLGINDTVRWEIVVSNYTGTDDIVSYQVTDTLDYPYKVNALEITVYNKENRIVLPKQSLTIHEEEVLGETTTDPPSVYTIMLSDSKYTIPAGGYAVISVDSTQMSGLAVYGAFDNSARLELVQSFTTGDVTNGTVGRNEEGKLVIDSSDEIEILGLYSTKSYKEVWEKDNPENLASSERNAASKVAVIENPDRIVTYALNIINTCAIPLTGFVLVDSMPRIGDTGIFDTYAGRDSEFEVAFAEQLNLSIQVIGKTGTTRQLDPSLYKVEFGEERSFNTSDVNGEANGRWTTEFYQEAQSIRIIISDQVNLVPGEAFRILFDGQCSTEALPGETAWNAFGYQYYTTIQNTETGEYEKTETNLNAAPPKVGIQIQPVPSLKKVVVDEQGNLVDSDGTEEFTFRLYEGKYSLEEITEGMSFVELKVQAGKAVSLSPYLKQFKTYTIVEVLEEGSSYELKYLYLNSDNSMNTVNGYSFLYKGEEDFLLQAVNEIRTCGITIEKVDKDSVGQEKMEYLAGAEFTLERKEGDSYVFVSKLTTPESGVVDFAQLLPGEYLITETKAPDGYQKLKEPITIKLPLSYQAGDLVNGNVVTTDGETTHVKLLVTNAKLSLLPSFGGSGDSTMTVYGLILLATGIFMFGYEKKRSRKGEIV